MQTTFKHFWNEFRSRGRFALAMKRCRVFYVTEDDLRRVAELAYNRGTSDALIAQGETELQLFDNLRREIAADEEHRRYRAEVGDEHFLVQPKLSIQYEAAFPSQQHSQISATSKSKL